MNEYDVIVIGGGQSGLAAGYYLRRSHLRYIILDKENHPGGSWQYFWKSLRLFSPAQWSSLPGIIMNGGPNYYATRDETIQYLTDYEKKYELNVLRPVEVWSVTKTGDYFSFDTTKGLFQSKAVISATGSFGNPLLPEFEGMQNFKGKILHSSRYQSPEEFSGKRVAIVGEGNSGAQILAEVSKHAETLWITLEEPKFLPDHVDGRFLFDAATQMYEAKLQGKDYKPPTLKDIVVVDSVREARERGVFEKSLRPFDHFTTDSLVWKDGRTEKVDAVIFCTGFKNSLEHLKSLPIFDADGKVLTEETRSKTVKGLWFLGYGNWTGFASATLIGVGRSARQTVNEIIEYLK